MLALPTSRVRRVRWPAALAAMFLAVGCSMPNSSNPTLSITHVEMDQERAVLDVTVSNPSEHELELQSLAYTLVFGPLPVAQGRWTGSLLLPAAGSARISLLMAFDAPLLDPSAPELELTGEMTLADKGDPGDTGLAHASFRAVAPAPTRVIP